MSASRPTDNSDFGLKQIRLLNQRLITHCHTTAPEVGLQKVSEMFLRSDFMLKSSATANISDCLKTHCDRVVTHGHTKAIKGRRINLEGF